MKYKAIIFDLDGTIVDTEKIWSQANKVLLERKGIVYTEEVRALIEPKVHGLATHRSCHLIKEIMALSDPLEDLIHENRVIARDLYQTGIDFIKGFIEFHDHIEARGIHHGIATNADDLTVEITNKALNLKKFFGEHIYGISCVDYVCKPDPAIYLHAAQKLDCKPEECIAIEDSAHGVAAAKSAGMYCLGINTSLKPGQLEKADQIVHGYHEIDLTKVG